MSTKTLSDLETEAFGILTGLDPSQQPAAEDLETIGKYVDPLLEQLSADGIIAITDKNSISQAVFLPLTRLLANVAGPRFGSPMNADAKKADEAALRRIAASRPTYETIRAEYF
jgi:hypothetical protein